jgi:hypothetical protein
VSNSADILAGFVIAYLLGRTHSTDSGVYTLAVRIAIGGLMALAMPKHLVNL